MAILQKKTSSTSWRISIVIINYQTDDLVVALIKSIGNNSELEIILIDNSPVDSLKKKLPKYTNIRYYFQNKNRGFCAGNNIGIKKAKGKWIFLLNSDTVVEGKDIKTLVEVSEAGKYQVAAPKLLNKDKTAQQSVGYFDRSPRYIINRLLARPRFISSKEITQHTPVDLATGAALLVKKTVFQKVGLLDEKNFFMYFEDIDFCYRLFKRHIPILFVPSIEVMHYGGQSANQDTSRKNENYTNARNAYIKKHCGSVVLQLNKIMKLFK